MVAPVRTNRVAFRRAVAASVALHVALAAALVIALKSGRDAKPSQPGIDTRADEVVVRMSLDEPAITTQTPDVPPSPPKAEPVEVTGGLRPPLASPIAQLLPAEALALIRRTGPVGPIADPNVKPAGTASAAARPIHGAMTPGQTVVYVLDGSGSMGEFGKFAAARAALVATLRRQPEGVRFQVIAYSGAARPLFPGGCVPATPANVAAAEAKLLALEPAGRSNHAEAVRLAAGLRPDVILLLTDADDLSAAQFKSALAAAGKPIPVCVAKVTAYNVGTPQELR
jgi:von Willebrand factor type A domain